MTGLWACVLALGCSTPALSRGERDAGPDAIGPDGRADSTEWISYSIPSAPRLDLVFVLDNSPSMTAKLPGLADKLGRIVGGLDNDCTGRKFDLRAAIITSDMGTGGAITSGACGPRADGSLRGDQGRFQLPDAAACGVTDSSLPWLVENRNTSPLRRNFTGELGSVFACLLAHIGTSGCAYSQPLRALEAAFYDPSNVAVQRNQFLRPGAFLGIVIVTDQDDCSAGSDDGVFADSPATATEAARLRCTTRAVACDGRRLSDSPPGYPASVAFTADYATCASRTDYCPPEIDTAGPTDCNPFADVRHIADEIKQLKGIAYTGVVAVFGWPSDGGEVMNARLVVDRTVSPDHAGGPELFDVWPICYHPDHPPASPESGFDPVASAWGATPALRLSAFIDEFGAEGSERYSICQSDLSPLLRYTTSLCNGRPNDPCFDYKLLDSDAGQPGIQPTCEVWDSVPEPDNPEGPHTDSPLFPQCDDPLTAVPCWRLVRDTAHCPVNGQMIRVVREPDVTFNAGTRVNVRCMTCVEPIPVSPDQDPSERCPFAF